MLRGENGLDPFVNACLTKGFHSDSWSRGETSSNNGYPLCPFYETSSALHWHKLVFCVNYAFEAMAQISFGRKRGELHANHSHQSALRKKRAIFLDPSSFGPAFLLNWLFSPSNVFPHFHFYSFYRVRFSAWLFRNTLPSLALLLLPTSYFSSFCFEILQIT